MPDKREPGEVVDLLGCQGIGPVWGVASTELNATLLTWPPGHELVDDKASELDVLIVVLDGDGTAVVDGEEHFLVRGNALLVERGRTRAIRAGDQGLRYLSVHRRRGPLQVAGMGQSP